MIEFAPMLAPKRKGLARRSTGQKFYVAFELSVRKIADIGFNQRPGGERLKPGVSVVP